MIGNSRNAKSQERSRLFATYDLRALVAKATQCLRG